MDVKIFCLVWCRLEDLLLRVGRGKFRVREGLNVIIIFYYVVLCFYVCYDGVDEMWFEMDYYDRKGVFKVVDVGSCGWDC